MITSRLLLLGSALLACYGCLPRGDPGLGDHFQDDFNRPALGDAWRNTGGNYQIVDGKLKVQGARNRPLWLRRTLPRDVRVEFDVRSESPEGDIKVELFGDGVSKATADSYTATSYVIIFGGWKNSKNMIARLDEHGTENAVGKPMPVERGHTYHMKIERRGDTITAWADDQQLASFKDKSPLSGSGHEYFAFNNWQSELWFDNLRITPF